MAVYRLYCIDRNGSAQHERECGRLRVTERRNVWCVVCGNHNGI